MVSVHVRDGEGKGEDDVAARSGKTHGHAVVDMGDWTQSQHCTTAAVPAFFGSCLHKSL